MTEKPFTDPDDVAAVEGGTEPWEPVLVATVETAAAAELEGGPNDCAATTDARAGN